jgi:DNA-binding CsgD family transcriptional regulator
MKVRAAFADLPVSGITPAVLAIGRPAFPEILLRTLQSLGDVGHCMVFSFAGEKSARCLLDAGNIPIGADLGAAYSEHFHLADPNRDAIFRAQASVTPIVLPTFARRMYRDDYLKLFFDDSRIVDKFATAIWVDGTCFYVNLYRIDSQGRFSRGQIEVLRRVAPALSAAVARHFQEESVGSELQHLDRLFASAVAFSGVTGREKDVCRRILSGLSSEAISAELGISLHSTLTYRKRAYEKLGISSQNELFAMVLRLLAPPHALN